MRTVAFDLGDARIGVALSDSLGIIASGYETYVRAKNDEERDLSYLCRLIKEKECGTIVVGLAVNMDGSEGERAEMYRAFGEKLRERTGLPVEYEDEKLTTYEAEEILKERGLSRAERKKIIDRTAACIILQEYLDKQNRNNIMKE